jgi:xylulose-5-phosphate/fructose-6-phosphate phosphoketolase
MPDDRFVELFTKDTHVLFSFHGYASAIHQLLHARPNPTRFHVRGYKEEGTTTTPFDMVVLNETSRYDICMDAIRRSRTQLPNARELTEECKRMLVRHHAYVAEHLEDMPEIRNWTWSAK